MNRIDKLFKKKKKVLIIFLTAGDPDLKTTVGLVRELEKSGADLIELGIPFSDPLADGPVIQKASLRSLNAGTTVKKILNAVSEIRKYSDIPIVLFTAYNPIFKYGIKKIVQDAKCMGADGFLVPDLPPEESNELLRLSKAQGLKMIFLLAPTTKKERIKYIANKGSGFLYYISLMGVTGARESLARTIKEKVREIKSITNKPIVVGFGVSRPEHAKEVSRYADGVVVGSAVVKLIEKYGKQKRVFKEVGDFVKGLKMAMGVDQ